MLLERELRASPHQEGINIGLYLLTPVERKGVCVPRKGIEDLWGVPLSVRVRVAHMCDPACQLVSEYLPRPYVELVYPCVCNYVFPGMSVSAWEVVFWSQTLWLLFSLPGMLFPTQPHGLLPSFSL